MITHHAHPHRSGDVVVIHNGIITNYKDVKEGQAIGAISFKLPILD